MSRKTTKSKSFDPTVAQEKVNQMYQMLVEGVEQVYSSQKWMEFLAFQAKFHRYSFSNAMLIWLQMPTATRVAGFHTWKRLGRSVKAGETAKIRVLAPRFRKEIDESTGEEKQELSYFKLVPVFDISQTEGKDVPSLCEELDGDGEDVQEVLSLLRDQITIPVDYEDIQDGSKGYYSLTENRIALKKGLSPLQELKTLTHEFSHSLLHSKARELKLNRASMEVEAEGVAYVVASYFGLDTSEYSFSYVAGWANAEDRVELVKKVGETIQKCAREIIEPIEKAWSRTRNLIIEEEETTAETNTAITNSEALYDRAI